MVIQNKPLNVQIVKNIIGIFSSYITINTDSIYTVCFQNKYSKGLINLLSTGKISKFIFIENRDLLTELPKDVKVENDTQEGVYRVYQDKSLIEDYINDKIKDNYQITLKESEEAPNYYVVDNITEFQNNRTDIKTISNTAEKHPNVFELLHTQSEYFVIQIFFDCNNYKQEEYLEYLINTFNNETSQPQTDLEYLTSVMKLCLLLQRAHLLVDCNGRYSWFNIVPALLMKRKLWLTRHPFSLWELIDRLESKELAKYFYKLCIKVPNILPNYYYHWIQTLPKSEQIRIACITGNKSVIENILHTTPKSLLTPVEDASRKTYNKPLEILKKYGHQEIYEIVCSGLITKPVLV